MAASHSRRPRDDDDDRPRRGRDEDDDDDRPRSRRYHNEDEDEVDLPRRRRQDEDDHVRAPGEKRGPSTGLILGIVGGVFALVVVIVLVVLFSNGSLGGSSISYDQFKAINSGDTLEGLEKKFGRATKIDRSEWSHVRYGDEAMGGQASLADVEMYGWEVEGWYYWKRGSEVIYVVRGTDRNKGRTGLLQKVYLNSKALKANEGRYDPRNPQDISKLVPSYEARPVE